MVLRSLLLLCCILYSQQNDVGKRTFEIDYKTNQFIMNGKPFQYFAGEVHYFQIPHQDWEDAILKLKAAGLNAVQMYTDWSLHEPTPGNYDFSENADVVKFIQLAQKHGIFVLFRPGPYICGERDLGGYPFWLLNVKPTMQLRSSDPDHQLYVSKWFKILMPKITPFLFGNGGPIIMVQVENEYGGHFTLDQKYLIWLRDLVQSYVGTAALLYTCDLADPGSVKRGLIPGVFPTTNLGVPPKGDVRTAFNNLRKVQKSGPLALSELYAGWYSAWGHDNDVKVDSASVVNAIEDSFKYNASFVVYIFHGGTNFGFTSSSVNINWKYRATTTSYDFQSPVSEGGDLTDKFMAIRDTMSKHVTVPPLTIPRVKPKRDYGVKTLEPIVNLFQSPLDVNTLQVPYPISFEAFNQGYGFVAYTTSIPSLSKDNAILVADVRDRALVLINHEEMGVLQFTFNKTLTLPKTIQKGQKLTLLVENTGRPAFKMSTSLIKKGLTSNITLNSHVLENWTMTGYPLRSLDIKKLDAFNVTKDGIPLPGFFRTRFQLPEGEVPQDTFVDMRGWGKGVAFINNFNLGRYWYIGPQYSLYLPRMHLKPYPAVNTLVIFELHFTPANRQVRLLPYHVNV